MEEKKNLWSSYDEAAKKELHEINEKYKACLDAGKTERECVKLAVEMANPGTNGKRRNGSCT